MNIAPWLEDRELKGVEQWVVGLIIWGFILVWPALIIYALLFR